MSQMHSQKKEIDGHQYEMFMMEPRASNRLLTKVGKMILPSLGPIADMLSNAFSGGGKNVMDLDLGNDFFSKALTQLCLDLDEKTMDTVIDEFQKVTHVDGQQLDKIFAAHFLGRIDNMYKWLAWGMQVQWGKCWGVLADMPLVKSALAKTTEASQSPTT
jgi:hypothetical protein